MPCGSARALQPATWPHGCLRFWSSLGFWGGFLAHLRYLQSLRIVLSCTCTTARNAPRFWSQKIGFRKQKTPRFWGTACGLLRERARVRPSGVGRGRGSRRRPSRMPISGAEPRAGGRAHRAYARVDLHVDWTSHMPPGHIFALRPPVSLWYSTRN